MNKLIEQDKKRLKGKINIQFFNILLQININFFEKNLANFLGESFNLQKG